MLYILDPFSKDFSMKYTGKSVVHSEQIIANVSGRVR